MIQRSAVGRRRPSAGYALRATASPLRGFGRLRAVDRLPETPGAHATGRQAFPWPATSEKPVLQCGVVFRAPLNSKPLKNQARRFAKQIEVQASGDARALRRLVEFLLEAIGFEVIFKQKYR